MKAFRILFAFIAFSIVASVFLVQGLYSQDLSRPIVYSVPGMDKVDVHPDLIYKRDGRDEMKMDIYIPPGLGADARLPAVLFIHGGPLGPNPSPGAKDWGVYRSYGRLMAASGLVGVTFDHRYASMSLRDLEISFSDVEEAIRFVRGNAASYHIDPDRIALWAFSGGGPHLSLGLRGQTPYIRCLVSYYAILDLSGDAARLGETPQTMERYSPVAYLTKADEYPPPVLIGRAGLDSASINRSVELFVSRMFALNGDINLLNHPLGRHGFDAYDDDEQSRDVIAATVAFLKSRLNRPTAFEAKRARAAGELLAFLGEGKFEAAKEFVRTDMNSPGDKAVTDVLISEQRLTSVGNSLLSSNPAAAVTAFEWAVELGPLSPNAHVRLAAGYEAIGRADQAVAEAKKALDLLDKATDLGENWKKMIREAANALLDRLNKIHDAARRGDIEMMSLWLSRDPGLVNAKDRYGHTPLHIAAIYERTKIVDLLLEKGTDINIKSTSGATALNYAQAHGQVEVAKLLIRKGADQSARKWPVIRGDYLGQKRPGPTAELFAPGIISSPYWEHSPLVFSQDGKEIFWSVVLEDPSRAVILGMKRLGDEWTEPTVFSFSKPEFRDVCPTLSADGKVLYFTSCRPTTKTGKAGDFNMWFVSRAGEGWSEPQLLAPGIASGDDARPIFTKDGTMYFGSWREGSIDGSNIYRSALVDGQYTKPMRLEATFNTGNAVPTYVAPNGAYLIFESFKAGGRGGSDFWISFRHTNGSWGEAVNLGDEVNSKSNDLFGGFSPDGKYFFFVSGRNGNNDIYWIDAGVIEKIIQK